jgi:hypothetical protein
MNLRSFLLPLALFAATPACHSAHVEAPDGFAELEEHGDYDFRATSAAGVVIAVRAEKNDPRGNLAFWTSAIDHKLKKSGYVPTLEKPRAVETRTGLAGKQLKYKMNNGGRPHEYWISVFVTDGEVFVVEAAGDEAFFDPSVEKQIDAATATLET